MTEKAKPAGSSGGHRDFVVTNFLSLTLPSGLIIHNCTLQEKDGSRWIGLPARPYTKDGSTSYALLIEFATKEARQPFQTMALEAVDRLMEGAR